MAFWKEMELLSASHGFMGRDGLSPGSNSKLYLKSISIEGGKILSHLRSRPFCVVAAFDICCLSEVTFCSQKCPTTMERCFLLIEQGTVLIKYSIAPSLSLCQILYLKELSSAASESDKLAKLILLHGKGASSRSNQWQIGV